MKKSEEATRHGKTKSLMRKSMTRFVACIAALFALAAPAFYLLTKNYYAEDMADLIEAVQAGNDIPKMDLEEDIMKGIMLQYLLITTLLCIGIMLTIRGLSRKLWQPFDKTLHSIETFNLENMQIPILPETDVREFERLNNALHKLMKKDIDCYVSQKEFTENASHELQTPLAIFQTKLELLLQQPELTAKQADIIQDLFQMTSRLSRLNRSLLLLAKIDNKQFDAKENIQPEQFIDHLLSTLESISGQLHINKQYLQKPLCINANRILLESMVNNLFINAVRHTTPDGAITICIENNSLSISNTSTEPPLSPSLIFRRFYRPTQNTIGNGLGLAIVKAISMIIAMVITVALCDQVSSNVIKPLVARLRPSHAPELEGMLHLVNGYRGGLYGFVSSHAANSFGAVSLAALIIHRRWATYTLITLALYVSYSRIYLGVHYPADVVCGGMLGTIIGFCVYRIMCYTQNITKQAKLRIAFVICVFVFSSNNMVAEELTDSISVANQSYLYSPKEKSKLDKFSSSRLYQMTYVGVPLVAAGIIVKSEDDHFRSLRNDYMPKFRNHTDDYMQFAPAAVMLGLKTAGVESRSSWGRMLASDAFAAMLMGGIVNTLKTTTHVTRPDGSNNHSFPSGHTATAFMTATMLSKEYGYKSQWISIAAYTTATATGLMRMANNKHWLSDVLTGAGIGILTTEMGYWLADLIFKDKSINQKAQADFQLDGKDKPSFASLYVGLNVPLSKYDIDDDNTFRTSSGSSVGIEGAYFFNPYIGIGGRFTVSNTALIVNGDKAEDKTFFKSADMFVFPTFYHNECFPLVLLEAMEYGLPGISTTEGGIPGIVDNGKTGCLVQKHDAVVLAEKIQALLADADLRSRMGKAGREKFEKEFTLEVFEKRMKEILLGMLNFFRDDDLDFRTYRLPDIYLASR